MSAHGNRGDRWAGAAAPALLVGLAAVGIGCTGPDEFFRHRDGGDPSAADGASGTGGGAGPAGTGGGVGPAGTGGSVGPAGTGGSVGPAGTGGAGAAVGTGGRAGTGGASGGGSGGRGGSGGGGPTPAVSFFDDFEDGSATDWYAGPKTLAGAYKVVADGTNHVLQGTNATSTEYLLSAGLNAWTDQAVEAKVKLVTGSPSSAQIFIYARVKSADEYYLLYLSDDEIQVRKRYIPPGSSSGTTTTITRVKLPGGATVAVGTWYTLRLVVSGGTITGYVNDTATPPYLDAAPISNGSIGVGVTDNATAAFDDVRATLP